MTILSSRVWLNVALLVLVAGLVAVALWEPGIEPAPEAPALTERVAAAVQKIRIERPEEAPIVLERREAHWRVVEPLSLPANGFRIEALLEVLEAKSERRLDAAGLDLERFGLSPPGVTLFIDDLRLDFGETEALSGRRYVRVQDALHLTADRFYHQLVGGAPGFVDLNPLGPSAEPVALELPGLTLRLESGGWVVDPDAGYSADAVSRLVEAWRTAQAITVRAFEPQESDRTVAVRLRDVDEPLRFGVVETPHALVLARADAGVQYHLPVDAGRRLLELPTPPLPEPEKDAAESDGEVPAQPPAADGSVGEEGPASLPGPAASPPAEGSGSPATPGEPGHQGS